MNAVAEVTHVTVEVPAAGAEKHSAKTRIPSLDGLRAIAILLVLVGHLAHTRGFPAAFQNAFYVPIAGLGVKVFFVISGYIITHLLLSEFARNGRISLRSFYARRCLRILPLLFFCVSTTLLVDQLLHDLGINWSHALAACTFTVPVLPWGDGAWALGHIWSLTVEEHFYLVWPFLLARMGVTRAIWFGLAFILLAPAIRIGIYLSGYTVFFSTYPACGDLMVFGCLAAILECHRPELVARWMGRQAMLLRTTLIILMVAVTLLGAVAGFGKLTIPFGDTLVGAAGGLLLLSVVHQRSGLLFGLLNFGPLMYVGTLSYSLYLWQQIFLFPASGNIAWFQTFPLNLGLAFVAAIFSHYLIENPFLRIKSKFGK